MGCYADPLADRAAWDLAVALTGQGGPANRTSYDFYLTHDVDRLRGYHRPLEPARWAIGDLLKRGSPGQAWRRLYTGYLAGEPWQSFRELMAAAEQVGRPGRFYFIGPSALSMDSPYAHTKRTQLKKVSDENVARMRAFLPLLPGELMHAFEFRHKSWFADETMAELRQYGVAFCSYDMVGFECPLTTTAPYAYLRFHGSEARYASNYTDEMLEGWAARLRVLAVGVEDVFVYFNNDAWGFAVANALKLAELLRVAD
jgi:hypothetical protein